MPVTRTSFKPGCNGNPGGRRKDPQKFAAFRERCRALEPEALAALAERVREGDMRAIELVLAYAWGKPPQPVVGEGGEGPAMFRVVIVDADTHDSPAGPEAASPADSDG